MDASGCVEKETAIVALNNTVTASIPGSAPICQGKKVLLAAVSNAETFAWTPTGGLSNRNVLTPEAGPDETTVYMLTATTGICQQTVNTTVTVFPAPIADAVGRTTRFAMGLSTQLHGSGGNSYGWTPATYLTDPNVPDPGCKCPLWLQRCII